MSLLPNAGQMRLVLGGTILLLEFGAINSLYAATADGMALYPAATRTTPKTAVANETSATKPGGNIPQTRPAGEPAPGKAKRPSADASSAIPIDSTPVQQTRGEQQFPPARNGSPLRITRQQTELVEPLLQEAYLAYRSGKLEQAQQLYLSMIRKDMHNSDALLGLAAIALQRGESLAAAQYFTRMLALDPRNAMANAGMAALSADDGGNESRLKILLRDQGNSAILHFALGNLYARQMRWSEAQQAYFNAYTLESGNAAFAFNLAVSLDHLGQRNSATQHYQTALQLDQANNAGFDHEQISQRIKELIR